MPRKFSLFLVSAVFVCVALLVIATISDCSQRIAPPDTPLYPESVLTSSILNGVGKGSRPLATYHYTVPSYPEDVIAYYQSQGDCNVGAEVENPEAEVCQGSAIPFGEYTVYIYLNSVPSQSTSYVIEIRWDGCVFTEILW